TCSSARCSIGPVWRPSFTSSTISNFLILARQWPPDCADHSTGRIFDLSACREDIPSASERCPYLDARLTAVRDRGSVVRREQPRGVSLLWQERRLLGSQLHVEGGEQRRRRGVIAHQIM